MPKGGVTPKRPSQGLPGALMADFGQPRNFTVNFFTIFVNYSDLSTDKIPAMIAGDDSIEEE
jgi:hypothetical protein